MVLSMTGYGREENNNGTLKITVEIKSLNSKYLDLRYKSPSEISNKEIEIRQLVKDSAKRGKLDLDIQLVFQNEQLEQLVNLDLIKKYTDALTPLADQMDLKKSEVLDAVLQVPSIWETEPYKISDDQTQLIYLTLKQALDKLYDQRSVEGEAIRDDIFKELDYLKSLESQINDLDEKRNELIRDRLDNLITKYISPEQVDKNRFEQEMIYYLEKIDINEERQRLLHHCQYFIDTANSKDSQVGKKLSFITQELGREINTLGAKAYSSDIQKIVVEMKNSLEKIKEQVANVL